MSRMWRNGTRRPNGSQQKSKCQCVVRHHSMATELVSDRPLAGLRRRFTVDTGFPILFCWTHHGPIE